MKHTLVSLALAAAAFSSLALPSVEAVQAEVQRGNYATAESMMKEVVTAKPKSARAQYIYAEVLAHNKHFEDAERALKAAHQLDPETKFTQPDKLKAFEALLTRARAEASAGQALGATGSSSVGASPSQARVPMAVPAQMSRAEPLPERSSGMPGWIWGALGAVAAVLVWRKVSASRRQAANAMPMPMPMASNAAAGAAYAPGYGPMQGPGYGAGYPQQPAGGNGMLHTGIAVAGGFAAGMLADKMLNGGDHRAPDSGAHSSSAAPAGGLVPGMFDDAPPAGQAWSDLQQQPVDFGSGDGWGGGDSGGSDSGGSDDGW